LTQRQGKRPRQPKRDLDGVGCFQAEHDDLIIPA
jgi:hypothetical protein